MEAYHILVALNKAMAVTTSRCGCRVHITDLHKTISHIRQSVGHHAPVVLLNPCAAVVKRDRCLCHNHGVAPLKPRLCAIGKLQDYPYTS